MARSYLDNDIRVTFKDGAGTPASLVISGQMGDVALQGLRDELKEWVIVQVRGANHSRRHGNRVDPTISFSVVHDEDDFDAAATAPGHWINEDGPYTGLTSTDTDADGLVFDVLIEFLDAAAAVADQYLCEDVVCESYDFSPGKPCTHSFNLRVTGAVTPS